MRVPRWLQGEVDATGVAAFRIGFGLLTAWDVAHRLASGSWASQIVAPTLRIGFPWWPVPWAPPPGVVLWGHVLLVVAALGVAVGWRTRRWALTILLVDGLFFLLDATLYLNHRYLMLLLAGLLAVVPTDQALSLRARREGERSAPRWVLQALRFQIAVPYVFAGVAKLNGDWLRGVPFDAWLARHTDVPVLGPLWATPQGPVVMAWLGLVFDLLVPALLLWRPSRLPAWLAVLVFHTINSHIFRIGVFPWMMLALTPVLLSPDWPRALRRTWREGGAGSRGTLALATLAGAWLASWWPSTFAWMHVAVGGGAFGLGAWLVLDRRPETSGPREGGVSVPVRALAVWALLQCLVPLRHLAIPGDVAWTEEGHRFAWRMKLRDKEVVHAVLKVTDLATGRERLVAPETFTSRHRAYDAMVRPDLLVSFAHALEAALRRDGGGDLSIQADVQVVLNGRAPRPLVDPSVDLTAIRWPWPVPAPWITTPAPPVWETPAE